MNKNFFIVIPFYNEEKLIRTCLKSLLAQVDQDFKVILVDNNSTDKTVSKIKEFINLNQLNNFEIIKESLQGTGAAADTGFRYSIEKGAEIIARTDADVVLDKMWVSNIKKHFREGILILGGKLKPRKDESFYSWLDGILVPILIKVVELGAKLIFPTKGYKYRMFMIAGLNMAIAADLYIQSGGFPRESIKDMNDDEVLHMRVRKIIDRKYARFATDVIVYGSIRRVKEYGYINTLLWYWDRKYKPKKIDIR